MEQRKEAFVLKLVRGGRDMHPWVEVRDWNRRGEVYDKWLEGLVLAIRKLRKGEMTIGYKYLDVWEGITPEELEKVDFKGGWVSLPLAFLKQAVRGDFQAMLDKTIEILKKQEYDGIRQIERQEVEVE